MPNQKMVVINTTPLLALTAGLGHLDLLQVLYAHLAFRGKFARKYGLAVDMALQLTHLNKPIGRQVIDFALKESGESL